MVGHPWWQKIATLESRPKPGEETNVNNQSKNRIERSVTLALLTVLTAWGGYVVLATTALSGVGWGLLWGLLFVALAIVAFFGLRRWSGWAFGVGFMLGFVASAFIWGQVKDLSLLVNAGMLAFLLAWFFLASWNVGLVDPLKWVRTKATPSATQP
jgi:hypothetical protein